ncbi:MAG: carboxypeptidase regulatory-like domain-containing protein [candidate division Zixibacteria bacterium]|nr:carboxypeptidase regulatory-like domain-containing protein [candidate division Zixibacteria bacterium]
MTKDNRFYFSVLMLLVLSILFYFSCGKDSSTSSTVEVGSPVSMTGELEIPDGINIDPSTLNVSFGDEKTTPNSDGEFNLTGSKMIPGLAMAYDLDTSAILMKIVPYPMAGMKINLDIRSTALALVYMNPFVCVGEDYKAAVDVITKLESLPQLDTLETIIGQKLALDPGVLGTEDEDISIAVARVMAAYLDLYPNTVAKHYPSIGFDPQKISIPEDATGGIGILPTVETSGHSLTYAGKDTYQITNAYGRWAKMYIEKNDQEMWLPPNGGMLDFIRDGLPWAPSSRTFNMVVTPDDDTVMVHIYGYGMSGDASNSLSNLTADELSRAHQAGLLTFFFEFCGHLASVVSNSVNGIRAVDGYETFLDDNLDTWWLDLAMSDANFLAQVELLYEQKLYSDMAWLIAKKLTELISANAVARDFVFRLGGKAVSDASRDKLHALASSPAFYAISQGFIIGNKLTSVMKTVYGFGLSQVKTTFKIWKEIGEFGDITGYVVQKDFPFGIIENATVVLGGDEENPLQSHVTTWKTDADGGFRFSDCLIGTKTVTASKPGYETTEVSAVVLKGAETPIIIELPKETGVAKGNIVNEIKLRYRDQYDDNQDTLFTRDTKVTAWAIIDEGKVEEIWTVSNGQYFKELPVASWWIKAEHDDYFPDSLQIVVTKNDTVSASGSLTMKPKGSMTASIFVENVPRYSVDFPEAASIPPGKFYNTNELFFYGAEESSVMHMLAIRVNMNAVKENGFYSMGDEYMLNAGNTDRPVAAGYVTDYVECNDGTDSDDMEFAMIGYPGADECDCGIEPRYYGNIIFTEYGLNLGDVIAGEITCKLAGWSTCYCIPIDNDNDGTIDEWQTTCQNADIDAKFRIVVGSFLTRDTKGPLQDAPDVLRQFMKVD